MNNTYILCRFNYGYSGLFYQEISQGVVNRYVDLDGNTLNLNPPYGYDIIDNNPPIPSWAN